MNEFIFGQLSSWEYRAHLLSDSQKGVRHNWQINPITPTQNDRPVLTVKAELDQPIEGVTCTLLEPTAGKVTLDLVSTEWDSLNWTYSQVWQGRLEAQPDGTIVRYKIHAQPSGGSAPIAADDGTIFSYLVGDTPAPSWSKTAIVYQIFPDRFHPGMNNTWNQVKNPEEIHGGTLRGIIESLDYIADLGFNCIWLNPIFPDSTHHGYQATNYFTLNPRLGSMDDLHEFVEGAHARGIHLLLDFAANHWGRGHATFQAALADRESEYHDWYLWIDWPDRYKSYFGLQDLPKLNVNNPKVRAHLRDAAAFWLTEIGFDGLRLDHAQGVDLNFWTEFRREIKALKPDAWMFGEVTDSPSRQLEFAGRLDGCLDFILAQAFRDTFAFDTMNLSSFDAFLYNHARFFPPGFSLPSFLDNHDMDRFLHISKGDKRKLKLAALCLFTLPGPPIIYYGTDVGVRQEYSVKEPGSRGLVESRQPMLWGPEQDQDLHSYFRWLIHFRREHPVLVDGLRATEHLDDSLGTYAYSCSNNGEKITIAFNLSDESREIHLDDHSFTLSSLSGEVHIHPPV